MPPGLTEEPGSDKSDSPVPASLSTHSIPLSAGHTPKMRPATALPNLAVSVSPSAPSYSSPQHASHVPTPRVLLAPSSDAGRALPESAPVVVVVSASQRDRISRRREPLDLCPPIRTRRLLPAPRYLYVLS
ncbi:hypothetical protein FKP32DRAFT_1590939 [Trametes sanguinea]|nr:hypothetical protein FKP32DRAFT_1590939 [Trametes sanguinea]